MIMLASVLLRLQEDYPQELPGGTLPWLLCLLVVYAFAAYCIQTIANKTNTENAWFAWVPILNLVLLLQIAKKPVWWIILMLIPLVNIVVYILVLIAVCEARGKSPWLTVALLLPVVNLVALGYLAFSD
ncbi:MAG: DUF5684 domain-containing protein [Acidobacteriota bacterium]|nr:DUF5684 domain-containing protein [Acidobacteriota bacterium]